MQIKPDGVQRNIVGEVIKRFEQKGFRLVALKMTQVTVSCSQPAYAVASAPAGASVPACRLLTQSWCCRQLVTSIVNRIKLVTWLALN